MSSTILSAKGRSAVPFFRFLDFVQVVFDSSLPLRQGASKFNDLTNMSDTRPQYRPQVRVPLKVHFGLRRSDLFMGSGNASVCCILLVPRLHIILSH